MAADFSFYGRGGCAASSVLATFFPLSSKVISPQIVKLSNGYQQHTIAIY
jgi:hypothetical protein